MFNIKKSLLCISAISCMSLYATMVPVDNPITIGDSTKGNDNLGINALSNYTHYN